MIELMTPDAEPLARQLASLDPFVEAYELDKLRTIETLGSTALLPETGDDLPVHDVLHDARIHRVPAYP